MAKLKSNSQPLRNPGQSIDKEIERVIHDEFPTYFVLALMLEQALTVRSCVASKGFRQPHEPLHVLWRAGAETYPAGAAE